MCSFLQLFLRLHASGVLFVLHTTQGSANRHEMMNCVIVYITHIAHMSHITPSTSNLFTYITTPLLTHVQHQANRTTMLSLSGWIWCGESYLVMLLNDFIWTFHIVLSRSVYFHLSTYSILFLSFSFTCFTLSYHQWSFCRLRSVSPANVPLMSVVGPSRHGLALS